MPMELLRISKRWLHTVSISVDNWKAEGILANLLSLLILSIQQKKKSNQTNPANVGC